MGRGPSCRRSARTVDVCACLCVHVQGVFACMYLWSSMSWCIQCIHVYPVCDRVSVSLCSVSMSMWTAVCEVLCALCMSGVFEHVCALFLWICLCVDVCACALLFHGSGQHMCVRACVCSGGVPVCERVCHASMPLCLGDIGSWMTQYPVSGYRCHACAHTSVCRPLCICQPHVCLPTGTRLHMCASQGAWGWAV